MYKSAQPQSRPIPSFSHPKLITAQNHSWFLYPPMHNFGPSYVAGNATVADPSQGATNERQSPARSRRRTSNTTNSERGSRAEENYQFVSDPSVPPPLPFTVLQPAAPPANGFGRITSGFKHYNHKSKSYDANDLITNTATEPTHFTFQLDPGQGSHGPPSSEWDSNPVYLHPVGTSESEAGRRGEEAVEQEETNLEEAMHSSYLQSLDRMGSPSFSYSSFRPASTTTLPSQPPEDPLFFLPYYPAYPVYTVPYQDYAYDEHYS
jgi:hypothetical protein